MVHQQLLSKVSSRRSKTVTVRLWEKKKLFVTSVGINCSFLSSFSSFLSSMKRALCFLHHTLSEAGPCLCFLIHAFKSTDHIKVDMNPSKFHKPETINFKDY
ncbi:uncharacterized protein LOC132626179 isoform X2 [Lycium barbarum]|uniref:uncharacterized protein LOC132626179 isoform X2 n=1 Tax=Lycium barbarum TaxID=112863 RepID=UPI00293E8867|nr:uncharacterized protein LOC132626179 isoform X2 [Lycium barbarum]